MYVPTSATGLKNKRPGFDLISKPASQPRCDIMSMLSARTMKSMAKRLSGIEDKLVSTDAARTEGGGPQVPSQGNAMCKTFLCCTAPPFHP